MNSLFEPILNQKLDQLVDKDNRLFVDIFTPLGAMVIKKGTELTPKRKESLSKILLALSSYDFKQHFPDEHINAYKSSLENEISFKKDDQKELLLKLEKDIGIKTVEKYLQINEALKELFGTNTIHGDEFQKATKIAADAFSVEPYKLNYCIKKMRKTDAHTLNHSLSVFYLFSLALVDINRHLREKGYEIFFENRINFNPDSQKEYAVGALIHDFGRLVVPTQILNKEGQLNEEERKLINFHPSAGVKLAEKMGIASHEIIRIIGDHHGKYRTFKKLEVQSPLATVCNILDIYDACRTKVVYRNSFSFAETKEILEAEKELFDWNDFIFNILINETLPNFEKNILSFESKS